MCEFPWTCLHCIPWCWLWLYLWDKTCFQFWVLAFFNVCFLSFLWSAAGMQKISAGHNSKAFWLFQLWQIKLWANTEVCLCNHAEPVSQHTARGTCWCCRLILGFSPTTLRPLSANLDWKHSHVKGQETGPIKSIWCFLSITSTLAF